MMKKLILGLVITLFAFSTYGQGISKLRATHSCYLIKSSYSGNWLDWSDWEPVNIIIVINTNKLRITIYSDVRQEFDITEIYATTDDVIEFRAVDQNGIYCGIKFVEEFNESHIYIEYSDMKLAYNVKDIN